MIEHFRCRCALAPTRRPNARALVDARDQKAPVTRSKLRPYYLAHLSLGALLPGLVLAHTGLSLPANADHVQATGHFVPTRCAAAPGSYDT